MQGALLGAAPGVRLDALALACAALLAMAAPPCTAAVAQVSVDVPQGKTKSVRLRRLPRGAVLGVAISASAALRIVLVSAGQLKSGKPQALFRGAVDRRMSFRVVIPESDDYYLVLDNRRGGQAVAVTATIEAQKGKPAPPPGKGGKVEETRAGSLAPA